MRTRVFILVAAALLCASAANLEAQQSSTPTFSETFESTFARARDTCTALWSDHAFDPLRKKLPLGEEKPTFEMLKNTEKLKAKDRPLADLAIKTLEKCRGAYAATYAMLPPQVSAMIHGVERRQDAMIAELYRAKITFGEFNISMSRLSGELIEALSGVSTTAHSVTSASESRSAPSAALPKTAQDDHPTITLSHDVRLALVIGNSNYANLPKLSNPANDAHAMADLLTQIGYKTRLLLNASEESTRRDIRQFADDSTKADVALIFYAGHGAQINGNNYLLPVDIEIPRTEADVQFSGLKVDDLINSIGSNTKIVFLDACRDNPVLFKNLVRGRGSPPTGLAPASSSNFDQKAGGGVFIAYATDAGAVADDGNGKHSPFTQALLRNIQKPISIDDMFSLVTREVRLVTKNAQRPYKYASLENIVCVSPHCSNSAPSTTTDVFQQASRSEAEELQIALQTNNSDALETYLQKYPDSPARSEIQRAIAKLERSEFTEWTLYEIGDKHMPQYVQMSSIQRFGARGSARTKILVNPTAPKVFFGKPIPDAAYQEQINVYDCASPMMAGAEDFIFSGTGELLFHYKWGDPQYMNISAIGFSVSAGSIGYSGRNLVCDNQLGTPLLGKKELANMSFRSLSSTVAGDGEIFISRLKKARKSLMR